MLNRLFNLTRPLFVLDTETTGTDPERDRVIEVGFQQWDATGMVKEWRTLVDPGVPIPEAASRIHGITDAKVIACRTCGCGRYGHEGSDHDFHRWPRFADLAANLAKGLVDCDFAGQHVRFDLRIIAAEMQRAKVEWSYADARIVDSLELERLAYPRDLGSLHERYVGQKHDGAHGALSDCRATATVLCKQLEAHSALPRDLGELHRAQWPGWIDGSGRFRFDAEGEPRFSQWGKHAGRRMRDVEVSYWDWILGAEFPSDVKRLASEAKLGRFPRP